MKKAHLAKLIAVGVGITSISVEASVENAKEKAVFSAQPRVIELCVCNASALTLVNMHQMIEARNNRDTRLVSCTADRMCHI